MNCSSKIMNSQIETPGYVLNVSYPVQPNRKQSFTFRDSSLLSARQAAFQKAQQVAVEKNPDDVIDIDISLVMTNRSTVPNRQQIIATIYRQRFNRSSFISDEGKDLLVGMNRNSLAAKSLPNSIFLTIGLERSNEDGNSLEVIEKSLTADELAHYQKYGYSINLP